MLRMSFRRLFARRLCLRFQARPKFRPATDALKAAGCEKLFVEKASGAQRDRPDPSAALNYLRQGTAVLWKLDRLTRSLKKLIETVALLESRSIELCSLTEAIDATTAGEKLAFQYSVPWRRSNVRSSANTPKRTGGCPCPRQKRRTSFLVGRERPRGRQNNAVRP